MKPGNSSLFTSLITVALASQLHAADGTWNSTTSNSWNSATSPPWAGSAIADGSGSTAFFDTLDITSDVTVTLGGNRTIGNLSFGDTNTATAAGWNVTGNTLTLSGGTPTITVGALGTGKVVTISSTLAGSSGLIKAGDGPLKLTALNSYTGETTVNAGTLELNNATGGNSRIGGTLTVNSGGTVSVTGGDGTGLGFAPAQRVVTLNINGGTVDGTMHVFTDIVNMTGGTLSGAVQLRSNVTTFSSANTATISGTLAMRDNRAFTVADGAAATDLLMSANISSTALGYNLNKSGAGTMALTGTNSTYTGLTAINAGTLNVASFSNYGVNGGLGNRSAANETASGDGIGIRIGTGTTGATLQYTGSTAQSTNRQIRLSAANNTIDASGTGAGTLSFTFNGTNTNLFETAGVRTLTLTGSNTGNNTFAIGLTNQGSNATSLTKSGVGTWVISGNSSYTGATSVTAGTLVVNGNISTSITTVSGGTLGGSGTVGATVIQSGGTLAPGNSIGTLNFSNTLSLAGISDFEIDPLLGLGLNADRANVTGAITYGGTLNVLYGGANTNFANGMVFNLFDGSSFSGSFGTLNLPSLPGGLSWQDNLLTNGTLVVVPEPNVAALIGALGGILLLRRRR